MAFTSAFHVTVVTCDILDVFGCHKHMFVAFDMGSFHFLHVLESISNAHFFLS